ncbi:MAG: nucleoside deaminase [Bacteroidetes bacterium]|nr:MAG: nucleoside deaminase [Bacteroidota bacterium]
MEPGSDEYYMRMALAEAEKAASRDEVPVGAVVVAGGSVIARAHNLTEALNDPTAHAEMQAITAAASYLGGKYLTGCTIYVTVEPCVMCAGALAWSQISAVVYGAPDPKKGYTTTGVDILHPRTEVRSGVMSEECSALMKKFFRKKRD